MRGIAKEAHPAIDPALDRVSVAGDPGLPVPAVMDDGLSARVNVGKLRQDFFVRDGPRREYFGWIVVAGDGEVEHLPSRERVVDEVAFRACPQCCGVPPQIFWHLLRGDDRAVGRMPGDARLAVANQLL